MASYQVASDNFVVAGQGATVTDEELEGCNVPALVEAGVLVPASSKSTSTAGKSAQPGQAPPAMKGEPAS